MTRYVLDTSFVIDQLRGEPSAVARFDRIFADGDQPVVTEVVACEAWTGAPSDDDHDLTALLSATEFVQPGRESARVAGRWRADSLRRGATLSLPDALIAAAADALGATVLTRNVRDFSLTPVRIERY
jgi:predicted nucleic acid-binding protein